MTTDYYKILGLTPSATHDEIKTAYRKLSKKFHPDLNQGDKFFEDRFKEIQEAYEKLTDPTFKFHYDQQFQKKEQSSNSYDNTTTSTHQEKYSTKKNTTEHQSVNKKNNNSNLAIKIAIPIIIAILFGIIRGLIKENAIESAKRNYVEELTSNNNSYTPISTTTFQDTLIEPLDSIHPTKEFDSKTEKAKAESYSNESNTDNFLNTFPLSFKIGETTETEIMNSGLVKDNDWDEDRSEILYRSDKKNVYCYVNKKTLKLSMMKIWEAPNNWKDLGINIGMPQEDLINIFNNHNVGFLKKESKFDDNIFINKHGLEYWFCFPKQTDESIGEIKNSLDFVVVKPYNY